MSAAYKQIAVVLLGAIYFYVSKKQLTVTFGDARRGFYYSNIRDLLLKLLAMPVDPKNWRPTMLVFSGNPTTRLTLVRYAAWLGCDRGIVTLVEVLRGDPLIQREERIEAHQRLQGFIEDNHLDAFPEVVVSPDFDHALPLLLQAYSIGPIKPNLAIFGWSDDSERAPHLARHLHTAVCMGQSLLVVRDCGLPEYGSGDRRIDIWWRGNNNGSLMVILAYLLLKNGEWRDTDIRILRLVRQPEEVVPARKELEDLLLHARIRGQVEIVCTERMFAEILSEHSHDATCVMLGFDKGILPFGEQFRDLYVDLVKDLPTTLLVCSSGDADLSA